MIRELCIGGFRGISQPITLDLTRNGKPNSLAIFGRNGFGKSSLADGWEWFHTGTIQHLAREGARAASYPSRGLPPKTESFVEVLFDNPAFGRIRLSTNSPSARDEQEGFREFQRAVAHPCHIRFEDLTRFVFLTKTQRFDELAQLMGFAPQTELLRQLRRVEGKFEERVRASGAELERATALLAKHCGIAADGAVDAPSVQEWFAALLRTHEVETLPSWEGVDKGVSRLADLVAHDAVARELAGIAALENCISRIPGVDSLGVAVRDYGTAVGDLHACQRSATDSLLLDLYQQAAAALARGREAAGAGPHVEGDNDTCPVCGQTYHGDLLAHLEGELHELGQLRKAFGAAEAARGKARAALPHAGALVQPLANGFKDYALAAQVIDTGPLARACAAAEDTIGLIRQALDRRADQVGRGELESLTALLDALREHRRDLVAHCGDLRAALEKRKSELDGSGARKRLVQDHQSAVQARGLWQAYVEMAHRFHAARYCAEELGRAIERYVEMNMADVEGRFAAISADVDKYFGILEEYTDGIAHPALRLVRDQDRAVVLEIEFHGDVVAPAYSFLSESQLNSFGLAVFLASARLINHSFRVLLLDDILNSFDAYKRRSLIRLLKQEFSEFQVILLTHDDVWWSQLCDQCPSWTRRKIIRYEPGIGPIFNKALSDLEAVQDALAQDDAVGAARVMGPMIERKLQEIGEAFRIRVEYNSRNEYTLRPLLQALVTTTKQKLGGAHPIAVSVGQFEADTAFRNFASHWKEPASSLTAQELTAVLKHWLSFEESIRCGEPKCGGVARWRDEVSRFVCECGGLALLKN